MEHIIHNTPFANGYGIGYKDDSNKNMAVFPDINKLLDHAFTKKYNLVYSNDSFQHGCDTKETHVKEKTTIMEKVLTENTDKFFMIIDQYAFNHHTLRQYPNCQVWPRKYFSNFFGLSLKDHMSSSSIQSKRKHWFCSVLGRSNSFRTEMFNYFIDNNFQKNNKISYLSYLSYIKKESVKEQQQNFLLSGGKENYKGLIPFNNFEESTAELFLALQDQKSRKIMPLHDCLFNIIVESFPTTGTAFYTEKSMHAVMYGHIPVVSGGPGVMKKLQDMGIIIPDYIQWPIWDDLEVAQLHMNKNHIIQRQLIDLFTTHKIEDISTDWYPYAIRNLNKLNNLKENCAMEEKEICRWILTATHSISNPKYQRLYQ